jgi:hypothetical protein
VLSATVELSWHCDPNEQEHIPPANKDFIQVLSPYNRDKCPNKSRLAQNTPEKLPVMMTDDDWCSHNKYK